MRSGATRPALARGIYWATTLLAFLLPFAAVLPDGRASLRPGPPLLLGTVTTASGTKVELFGLVGDVFHPRKSANDLGFDLVVVSCYFDPIELNGDTVLPLNPLLANGLLNSSRTEGEFRDFSNGLFHSLAQSSDAVRCFRDGAEDPTTCAGDRIVPYTWRVSRDSRMQGQGVSHIATIPLFDPSILVKETSAAEIRRRLAGNIAVGVRRLLDESGSLTSPRIRAVGLAALGSTSHAGDSPYFLSFRQGYFTLLESIERSRVPGSVDRIYLVAFDRHERLFLDEATGALLDVARYLRLRAVFRDSLVLPAVVWAIWLLIGLSGWAGIRDLFGSERFTVVAMIVTVLTVCAVLHTAVLQLTVRFVPETSLTTVHVANGLIVGALLLFLRWSRHARPRKRSTLKEQLETLSTRGR